MVLLATKISYWTYYLKLVKHIDNFVQKLLRCLVLFFLLSLTVQTDNGKLFSFYIENGFRIWSISVKARMLIQLLQLSKNMGFESDFSTKQNLFFCKFKHSEILCGVLPGTDVNLST